MIKVTVELLPGGFETHKQLLGTARIWNTGHGTSTKGQYKYELFGKKGVLIAIGSIVDFPRKRLLGWDLLRWVLNAARHDKQNIHIPE